MTIEESVRYPARIEVDFPETCSRGLALLGVVFLLKGLLLLPHIIVLYFLSLVAALAMYLAFWVVLITGRYPRGIFDFTVGVQRWNFRATAWMAGWSDRYPPFTLS